MIYPSNYVPKSMADLRKYEGFLPNMSGATYDPISLLNEEKNLRREQSGSFSSHSTRSSRDDDIFSNTAFVSLSSSDDSNESSQTSNDVFNESGKTVLLKTPKKTLAKRVSPRKPLKPVKSVNPCDPSFKGVTLHMKTTLKKGKNGLKTRSEAQLVIDCCFTSKKRRRCSNLELDMRECKTSRRRLSSPGLNPSIFKLQNSPESMFSDRSPSDVDLGTAPIQVEKECASCGTFKTPLWRDAEDGTHLCNACGIRYKKYRIRCVRCWYIPKKEEKALPCCTSCGHTYKIALGRKANLFSSSE
ncbi:GATA-type zinc finger protein 1 [Stylophora pistillata]|uniref:GATA-type zinc finger protein 1 n=2 Tax=Stylophora pistillata TaxID=50429 RepID=A0A2B4S2W5_STYPI|nr:GATA-type zinc finger protein 1 [Stylophora pistillata]